MIYTHIHIILFIHGTHHGTIRGSDDKIVKKKRKNTLFNIGLKSYSKITDH